MNLIKNKTETVIIIYQHQLNNLFLKQKPVVIRTQSDDIKKDVDLTSGSSGKHSYESYN